MASERVLGLAGHQAIYKSNSGGIRFKLRTTGRSPELAMIAHEDPYLCLYKLTLGYETTVYNMCDKKKETFPSEDLYDLEDFKEFYLTWHNNKIKLGLVGQKEFVDYQKKSADPIVGYIVFKTQSRNSRPVEWVIETSPVILKSISCKKFCDRLHWSPLIDGKLPPDAMIGGFENEPIYIARAHHNNSLCPGKYVKSVDKAFVPWGGQEHPKEEFEILCGYNCKWTKTRSNYIPQNSFIGGYSEVNSEPLYLGRAKIQGNLICGKVHLLYKKCYLPYQGREVEVSVYEILVIPDDEIPDDEIPQAILLTPFPEIE